MPKPKRVPRQAVDLGTPEAIRKRLERLGAPLPGWPLPDTTAAESLLGVLLWRGALGADYDDARRLHSAGVSFCGWWVRAHPKTFTQGTLGRLQAGSLTEVDAEGAEAALGAVKALLPRVHYDAVVNAAVYQRIPRWVEDLRAGLRAVDAWQMGARRAA
jgi:hypothetical protein